MGVKVLCKTRLTDFDGDYAYLNNGEKIKTKNVVWAAGVVGNTMEGIKPDAVLRGNRINVNRFNQIEGYTNVYAIGDIAHMSEDPFPNGHPQLAQPAIQQGKHLAKNFVRMHKGQALEEFSYKDYGSMATIGRHKAVVDLPFWRFQGVFAWLVWLLVHLFSILGIKNKLFVFTNWLINYITYDQSLRLIIKPKLKEIT